VGASIVGRIIMMGAARGRTPKELIVTGVLLLGDALLTLSLEAHSWWWVTASVVLFFTGFNYLEANFPALVSSIAPAGQKGTAMGLYASFQFFGAFLGGIISGLVVDIWSQSVAYGIGAMSTLLWLFVILGIKEVSRVKRVMMHGELTNADTDVIEDKLMRVPGVLEVTLNRQNNAVYLKVDRDFDAVKARDVLSV